MRTIRLLAAGLMGLVALGLGGCATVASPAIGFLITDVKGPIDAEGSLGSKEGRACAKSYLGVYAVGDASIAAAARAGGITNVTTVDHHSKHMVVIGEFCTIVRGN